MSDSRAVAAIDRLPWLDDEPQRSRDALHTAMAHLWGWLIPALLLVGGISFWLGSRTAPHGDFITQVAKVPADSRSVTTATLPEPQAPAVDEQVAPAPEVVAAPAAAPRSAPPQRVRHGRPVIRPLLVSRSRPVPAARKPAVSPPKLTYWPALTSAGASGRMVRIGTFASSAQAKRGWRGVVKIYPGMKHIPTVVAPVPSLRDGRTYFRLQMGTTSQAHSEVLCQRMRVIGQSCVVVGLSRAPS